MRGKHFKLVRQNANKYKDNIHTVIDGEEFVGKTIFPSSWDDKKIQDVASELVSRRNDTPGYNDEKNYRGTVDGVEVFLQVDKFGKTETIYPIF